MSGFPPPAHPANVLGTYSYVLGWHNARDHDPEQDKTMIFLLHVDKTFIIWRRVHRAAGHGLRLGLIRDIYIHISRVLPKKAAKEKEKVRGPRSDSAIRKSVPIINVSLAGWDAGDAAAAARSRWEQSIARRIVEVVIIVTTY